MGVCAVSVDLDEIDNYFQIHGLADEAGPGEGPIYARAIDRLIEWAKAERLPITFFAIGKDVATDLGREKIRAASAAGHEIANHTYSHRYDFSRLDRLEMIDEIERAQDAIESACGRRPVGFRAPGYTITDAVFDVLRELGFAYDSSVFPCPSYFAAKSAAIGWHTLRGRASRSVVDSPRVLTAPIAPYRVGKPYTREGFGVLELPIQVTPIGRLPVIGTSVTLGGPTVARWLARACRSAPLVNLELHGIDVLDAGDGLEALEAFQIDVRVPRQKKLDALSAFVATLRDAGMTFTTLDEYADSLGAAA